MNLPVWKLLVATCILGICGVATPELYAQKEAAKADSKVPEAKKTTRRLPNFFADLVDGVQKEKIYAVQDQYTPQIDALTAQVKALQAKRDADIEAVLNAEQKAKLEKARAEAKAKAAERVAARKAAEAKAGNAKPTPDAKPTATTTTVKPAK